MGIDETQYIIVQLSVEDIEMLIDDAMAAIIMPTSIYLKKNVSPEAKLRAKIQMDKRNTLIDTLIDCIEENKTVVGERNEY